MVHTTGGYPLSKKNIPRTSLDAPETFPPPPFLLLCYTLGSITSFFSAAVTWASCIMKFKATIQLRVWVIILTGSPLLRGGGSADCSAHQKWSAARWACQLSFGRVQFNLDPRRNLILPPLRFHLSCLREPKVDCWNILSISSGSWRPGWWTRAVRFPKASGRHVGKTFPMHLGYSREQAVP